MIASIVGIFLIVPPIVILVSLLEVWMPAGLIESALGKNSGAKGMLIAVLFGSVAAGPLFAAYPIGAALAEKGVRKANVVIFLGSWATLKIPLLMMESHFLGWRFSLLRLVVTLPFVILIGVAMEKT